MMLHRLSQGLSGPLEQMAGSSGCPHPHSHSLFLMTTQSCRPQAAEAQRQRQVVQPSLSLLHDTMRYVATIVKRSNWGGSPTKKIPRDSSAHSL